MEILGMSIIVASVVAAIGGVVARNVIGWLKDQSNFNIRNAAASAGIAVIVGIPIVTTAFVGAFESVQSIPEHAQLILFVTQIGAIAGFDALAKGSMKAATSRKVE